MSRDLLLTAPGALRPYDAMLIGRARAWAALCMAAAAESAATWDRMAGDREDRTDLERLVSRLVAAGMAERTEAGVRLVGRGLDAAAETRRSGGVPAAVQDDPLDWRQRAWTSMRIRRRFTMADVQAAAGAPSLDVVQKMCRELARAGILRRDGVQQRGRRAAWAVYLVMRDVGPHVPAAAARSQTRETDVARPWRRRAWSALWRLASGGVAVRVAELSAGARVPYPTAHTFLSELREAGAVVALPDPEGGNALVYALVPSARELAASVVKRSDTQARQAKWRRDVWRVLFNERVMTAALAAEVSGAGRTTAGRFLEACVDAGHLERIKGADGCHPYEHAYVPTSTCPRALPAVRVPHSRDTGTVPGPARAAQPEVPHG